MVHFGEYATFNLPNLVELNGSAQLGKPIHIIKEEVVDTISKPVSEKIISFQTRAKWSFRFSQAS